MSQTKLDEVLEVALIDLSDGLEISQELKNQLLLAFDGEEGLSQALLEARQEQALSQSLSRQSPSNHFVSEVMRQTRKRRRLRAHTPPSVYMEVWILGFLVLTLIIAWLSFYAHQRSRSLRLEGDFRPVPQIDQNESFRP